MATTKEQLERQAGEIAQLREAVAQLTRHVCGWQRPKFAKAPALEAICAECWARPLETRPFTAPEQREKVNA